MNIIELVLLWAGVVSYYFTFGAAAPAKLKASVITATAAVVAIGILIF